MQRLQRLWRLSYFPTPRFVPAPSYLEDRLDKGQVKWANYCRRHLSLLGIAIANVTSAASQPGLGRFDYCSYLLGAVRNEEDAFMTAFLDRLLSHPDLFQVITRSDTDPGEHVQVSGSGSDGAPLPWCRSYPSESRILGNERTLHSATEIFHDQKYSSQPGYSTASGRQLSSISSLWIQSRTTGDRFKPWHGRRCQPKALFAGYLTWGLVFKRRINGP